MTSRSSLGLAVLGLVLVLGRAEAQDTLQVPGAAPEPAPQIHVVQDGETLWTLAARYLGDALLWPSIYRLNTLVVEDPHWIYPGEALQLGGPPPPGLDVAPRADTLAALTRLARTDTIGRVTQDTLLAGPVEDTLQVEPAELALDRPSLGVGALPPPPPLANEPTVFAQRGGRRDVFAGRVGVMEYDAVGAATFYGAGFLTEGDRFPWASVTGAAEKATLGSLTSVSSARIFESIEVVTPSGASYHIGDSLLVAVEGREIPRWGRVIIPTGIARVREVSGRRVVADVLSQWSRVSDGQVAMPVEPFRNPGTTPPVPVDNGMRGTVVDSREINPITGAHQVVFIDRGRDDGVTPGDEFEVLRPNPLGASPESPLQQVAVLQVVHVRQHSAAALVRGITDLGVRPGAPVRLIRKMPT